MKIVYCIAGLYNSGGMERVLSIKANYLVDRGYDITIITTDQDCKKPFFNLDPRIHLIDLGINYNRTSSSIFLKFIQYLIKQIQHKRLLKQILNSLKADVVISMFDHEVSILSNINDGSKKVLEIHFSRFKRLQYGRRGVWNIIDRMRSYNDLLLARKYDKFVVLTEEDRLNWKGLTNIVTISNPNSFETKHYASLENKRVIAVGRLDNQKSFSELIYAWSYLDSKFSDWRLHIYGSGPMKTELHQLIESLKLQDNITIEEPIKNIKEKYLESSILVMTSKYEGLPMALLEGQVCGLPLISYECKCGPKDIISDGVNGYLIEEGNVAMLSEKMEILMSNLHLRREMGFNSINMSQKFSIDTIMSKWVSLFHNLYK